VFTTGFTYSSRIISWVRVRVRVRVRRTLSQNEKRKISNLATNFRYYSSSDVPFGAIIAFFFVPCIGIFVYLYLYKAGIIRRHRVIVPIAPRQGGVVVTGQETVVGPAGTPFIPASGFSGNMPGFEYRDGSMGTGYYRRAPIVASSTPIAQRNNTPLTTAVVAQPVVAQSTTIPIMAQPVQATPITAQPVVAHPVVAQPVTVTAMPVNTTTSSSQSHLQVAQARPMRPIL
jgi:hypothetical protein